MKPEPQIPHLRFAERYLRFDSPRSARMWMNKLTMSRYNSVAPQIAVPISTDSSETLFTIWSVSNRMYPEKMKTPTT